MLNRNAKTLKVYPARITTSKQLYFANLLRISILDSTQFSGYNIYPAIELIPDTTEVGAIALVEQFAYNKTAYETDSWFPGYSAKKLDNV